MGLKNTGIKKEDHRLKVHFLRSTYNTKMKTCVSGVVLREFIRHNPAEMTLPYSIPRLPEQLQIHYAERDKFVKDV